MEDYPAATRTLASSAQRLRGWVDTDRSRLPELGDVLVKLTESRLLAAAWREAASDAQDSLTTAGRLLASHGPLGPYTPTEDALRFVRAALQLADIQTASGGAEAAARTVGTATSAMEQLSHLSLDLAAVDRVRALHTLASASLAATQVASANSHLDAALTERVNGVPALQVEVLASRCRSAAGRDHEAAAWAFAALGRLHQLGGPAPAGLPPARLERLAELELGVARVLADALTSLGDTDWAIETGRQLSGRLDSWAARAPGAAAGAALSKGPLAADLASAGRADEALPLAEAAHAQLPTSEPVRLALAQALLGTGRAARALPVARELAERSLAQDHPGPFGVRALRTYLGALVANGEEADELRHATEQATAALAPSVPVTGWSTSGHLFARGDADLVDTRTRKVLAQFETAAAAGRLAAGAAEADRREAAARRSAAAAAADEAARLSASQRQAQEATEAAQAAALAAAQAAATELAEAAERKRRRAERIEEHRLASAADALVGLREARDAARTADRRALRDATDALAEGLRPLAEAEPTVHGPELVEVLTELAGLRLRTGDWWGSREPARQAKALAASLGL